ncbi:NUDIX domain-containing protein [Patescibacteria group bacterium AH-259-L07]|nr:NUDIX domain-containing protein [Patescibacteria group bacterium AH-259-L07]
MSEKLEIYDLDNTLRAIEERDKFYSEIKKEFKKTGKITKKVKSIRLFLLNSKGRIYLQKRSNIKNENPGLYDKTIGGHVSAGDTFDMTVIRECAEELGFPAAVVPKEDFAKTVKTIDLNIVGVFRKVDYVDNFLSVRIDKEGNKFTQPFISQMYIGYYDGSIKFVDGESSGIEVFSLDELRAEIKNNPSKFTGDVTFMIKTYNTFLKPII